MDVALQRLVWARAGAICEYCHMPQALDALPFCIDHIVAIKHHGKTEEANLPLACYNCNTYKGTNIAGIDPLTGDFDSALQPPDVEMARPF